MMSALDKICEQFIKILRKGSTDYAGLQHQAGVGSVRTVRDHVKHLVRSGLVLDRRKKKGTRRDFHEVSLTKKGMEVLK